MNTDDDVRLPLLFALLMAVFCCTAGRARAEYVDVSGDAVIVSEATAGNYVEDEDDGEDDTAMLFDNAYDASDTEESDTATPGSYTESALPLDDTVAESADSIVICPAGPGLLSLSLPMLAAGAGEEKLGDNLTFTSLSTAASLTGPNTVEITVDVVGESLKFYGFEIARVCELDEVGAHFTEPDVRIAIPDEMSANKTPVVESTALGTVSIDETDIRRSRYRPRHLKITWTLSGAEEVAQFAEELAGETIYLNLGGEYVLLDYESTDLCFNCGPIEVPGLAEAVRIASCPHTGRTYTPLDAEEHLIVCGGCGYDFGKEAHIMHEGSCERCGYSETLTGTIIYELNGRTIEDEYDAPEGTELSLREIPGYFVPSGVTVPAGGGDITVACDPISYQIITESEEYGLLYDESLFLEGAPKKGYRFTGYAVEDVL